MKRPAGADAELSICVLRRAGPSAAAWRQTGARVECIDWKRAIDPLALLRLRRFLNDFEPERIHVWQLPALRALALAAPGLLPLSIVSQALPMERWPPRLGTINRWLLRRTARVVASGATEGQCLRDRGVRSEDIAVIPPGVDAWSGAPRAEHCSVRVPPRPRIVCQGHCANQNGLRTALRAADYLGYVFPEMRLHIVGVAAGLSSLQRYLDGVFHRHCVHFADAPADDSADLADADVCWVPGLSTTSPQAALEALAAGRPVVAANSPLLREIITDGENGLLAPPGHALALARLTRRLLSDNELCRRLGEAGRRRALAFSTVDFIERWRQVYGLPAACISQRISVGDFHHERHFSIATADLPRNNAMKVDVRSEAP